VRHLLPAASGVTLALAAALLTAQTATAEVGAMGVPTSGKVTGNFNGYCSSGNSHRGVDIAAPLGRDVYAAYDGVVERAEVQTGESESYGLLVRLRHEAGYKTLYAHLDSEVVTIGQSVSKGDLIGRVGSTGNSTGPHLHFEVRRNNERLTGISNYFTCGRDVTAKAAIGVDFRDLPANSAPATPAVTSDLFFVKTSSTASGQVEVHSASQTSKYATSLAGGAATRFAAYEGGNGTFVMDDGDLYFIKTKNTASGKIEVHSASQDSDYQDSISGGKASRFTAGDAGNGTFTISQGNLYYIKTKNTASGKIEVHSASQSSGYQTQLAGGAASRFTAGDAGNGTFTINDGDLYYVKSKSVASGQVEIHTASRTSGYQTQLSGGAVSRFAAYEAGNGNLVIDDGNLFLIKTRDTAGNVEVHSATRTSGYQNGLAGGAVSRFGNHEAANGTFTIS